MSAQSDGSNDTLMEKIVTLSKRRGFVFPGSEIYGGLANTWDYGPLGTLLKNNIRDAWWRFFVRQRHDMVGLDAAILMHPRVWEISGHVASFTDPLVEDVVTHKRYRADHLIEQATGRSLAAFTLDDLAGLIREHTIKSPDGNAVTAPKRFNLMFETSLGSTEQEQRSVYLRPELAQSMFVDFKLVMDTMRKSIPFGIAQVGKVFRNEITPGNFTFRTLEFDLMEFEYFVRGAEWEQWFAYWLERMHLWLETIGISREHLRVREHGAEELSHYSKKTVDIEYSTPFGWKELLGLAYRGDFDLRNHSEHTGKDFRVFNSETGDKYFPHVIEPTFGLTRLALMVMLSAYDEDEVRGEKRVVMRFLPSIAPYQVAVLPLSQKDELITVARPLAERLSKEFSCEYDETQSIGRRYRRQDEIGTPYCVTVDFETLQDQAVTVRDRDTMKQDRVAVSEVEHYLRDKLVAAHGPLT